MVQKSTHKAKGYLFDDTPRGILEALLVSGGIALALTVAPTLFMALAGIGYAIQAEDRARRRKLQTAYQYLKRKEYLQIRTTGKQVRFELTAQGRARIERHIERRALVAPTSRPPVWDSKWRVILFDIRADERMKRNAFRGLIRRLGAIMLQKSVWIYPFDCSEQVALLRNIFHLSESELRLIVTDSIGTDTFARKHFKLYD